MFGSKWKKLALQRESDYSNLFQAVRRRSNAIKNAITEIEGPSKDTGRPAHQHYRVVGDLELLRIWMHADKMYWGE